MQWRAGWLGFCMQCQGGDVPKTSVVAAGSEGFRGDINGLRAWAVLAVVLYHFNVSGFGGGFAGVDVFFVISGFLMAGIVIGSMEQERFSLAGFYLARARRILPALIVLVVALLVVGWFLLMPREYQTLGKHARESLLFSSNLRYLGEAGYFDSTSHEKWLLHTWSLSVEWQFYLIYPLVLAVLARLRPGRAVLLGAHALALLASFLLCQFLTGTKPSQAFFLLQARAWELLLGGLVFLAGGQLTLSARLRAWIELLGIALIVSTLLLIGTDARWPGSAALLPTLGAALVLLACRQGSLWTGSRFAQWVGTRSYSIYLWHWPLVVGLVYFELQQVALWVCAGVLGALLLGHLSYVWVEVPARRWLARKGNVHNAAWLLAGLVVVAVSAQSVRRSGFPARLPEAIARIEAERHNRNPRIDECLAADASCVYGGKQVSALVIGDSHADAVVNAVAASLPDSREGVYFKGLSSCLMVFAAQWSGEGSRDECASLKKELAADLDGLFPGRPIILINRTSVYVMGELSGTGAKSPGKPLVHFSQPVATQTPEYLAEFRRNYVESVCQMSRQHPLYLVRPFPEMQEQVPHVLGRALLLGKQTEVSISMDAYRKRHAFIWEVQDEAAQRCGATILDPLPYLCDQERCYGSRNGWPLYVDDDHLSEFGNRLLVPMFAQVFAAAPAVSTAPAMPEAGGR